MHLNFELQINFEFFLTQSWLEEINSKGIIFGIDITINFHFCELNEWDQHYLQSTAIHSWMRVDPQNQTFLHPLGKNSLIHLIAE